MKSQPDDALAALEHEYGHQLLQAKDKARPPASVVPLPQKVGAHTLAVEASLSDSGEAIGRMSKLADSLHDHWKAACADAIAGNERIHASLTEAESAFKSAIIIIERTIQLCREEGERAVRTFSEHKEKIRRVVERCDAIERDISGSEGDGK